MWTCQLFNSTASFYFCLQCWHVICFLSPLPCVASSSLLERKQRNNKKESNEYGIFISAFDLRSTPLSTRESLGLTYFPKMVCVCVFTYFPKMVCVCKLVRPDQVIFKKLTSNELQWSGERSECVPAFTDVHICEAVLLGRGTVAQSCLTSRTKRSSPQNSPGWWHRDSLCYYYCNFTTSCIVTSSHQHSHTTTQKEHVLPEFEGDSVTLWKKPSQREGWKTEPQAVTGLYWKLVFKRPPFPSHSICSLTLPLTPRSLLFLLPSPEPQQETKDTLTSL